MNQLEGHTQPTGMNGRDASLASLRRAIVAELERRHGKVAAQLIDLSVGQAAREVVDQVMAEPEGLELSGLAAEGRAEGNSGGRLADCLTDHVGEHLTSDDEVYR